MTLSEIKKMLDELDEFKESQGDIDEITEDRDICEDD